MATSNLLEFILHLEQATPEERILDLKESIRRLELSHSTSTITRRQINDISDGVSLGINQSTANDSRLLLRNIILQLLQDYDYCRNKDRRLSGRQATQSLVIDS